MQNELFPERSGRHVRTIKNLLRDWGATSPPALDIAQAMNDTLELWARTLVEKVGLIKNGVEEQSAGA